MIDFYHDFKPIRNKIRKLDLLFGLEKIYSLTYAKKPAIIPELAEFIFINLLIYAEVNTRTNNEYKLLNDILRSCETLKNDITEKQIKEKIWRWLHSMSLNQLKANHNHYYNIIFRYYTIFSDEKISNHIEKRFGISYKSFFICALWLHSVFSKQMSRPIRYFTGKNNGGPMFSKKNMETTIALLSTPLSELKAILKEEVRYDENMFITQGYPHIRYPIFELDEILYCMYPDHLLNQLTAGTYYLAEIGENEHGLSKAYGDGFERYLGIILIKLNNHHSYTIHPEIQYKIGKNQNKSSDWIIETNDAIVFIECKTKKLRLKSKDINVDEEYLKEDIQHMVNAAIQLYKVYNHYVEGKIPGLTFDPEKKFFPLVVTLEDWFAGAPDIAEDISTGIVAYFKQKGTDTSIIDRFAFRSYSVNQLEIDIQLMFSLGFVQYFNQLETGGIIDLDRENTPYIDYFIEDFKTEFITPLKS